MVQTAPDPPRGSATGSGKHHKRLASDFPDNRLSARDIQAPGSDRAVKEARLELLREAIHESCGFIRLHAETCQLLVEAGDDAGMLHALGRLIIYTKHAARTGQDLRALRGGAP